MKVPIYSAMCEDEMLKFWGKYVKLPLIIIMGWREFSRKAWLLKIFLMVLFMIGITGFLVVHYHARTRNSASEHKSNAVSNIQFPKPVHVVQGLRYDRFEKENKLFRITADRFYVQKKKMGFFRFGLISEALFDNAFIQLYKRDKSTKNNVDAGFADVFDHALSLFPGKRILSVFMKPVEIECYDKQSLLSHIWADSAVISIKNQKMIFKGDVRIAAGKRSLTTDQLTLFPDNRISTKKHYVLKIGETQKEGDQITMDIFLNFIKR